ncbi:anti-sigma B factor antagonist [Clostridium cavendishii DSM 21758]|uniref:Anti-sigma B factor antagonist n=1 Tax=Clostridium cavendishii DSM 21758 TaxID=1121302 RepID=A0A1M6UGA0_9CLOT|nr:STAS domain-containing protein [Clostridium cavendishii]SHK68206.1 anti-sigma B factor antagonist [Clostridium cavendishii DSM 21758]
MNEINMVIPENFAVDEADEFREQINNLINKGEKFFTFDFKNCKFIDSTGLGVLVTIYKKCNELNGSVKLYSVNDPQVMKIFNLTRLDKVFGI